MISWSTITPAVSGMLLSTTPGKTVQFCIPWTEIVGIEKVSGGFKILTRYERLTFLFFFNLDETLHLVQVLLVTKVTMLVTIVTMLVTMLVTIVTMLVTTVTIQELSKMAVKSLLNGVEDKNDYYKFDEELQTSGQHDISRIKQ
eukprot:sb/3474025/